MSDEEMKAEEIYQTLAEHDIVYYEKRISQLKDPRDRWRCRKLLEQVKKDLLILDYRRQPC